MLFKLSSCPDCHFTYLADTVQVQYLLHVSYIFGEQMDILALYCVLLIGDNQLLMMTRDFDPLTEVSLYQSEFGEGTS